MLLYAIFATYQSTSLSSVTAIHGPSVFRGGVVLFTGQGYHFRIPYHPGPLGSLRVGKANDVPSSETWETYSEWAKSYAGDTIRLLLSNQHFVMLKSKKKYS